MPFPPTGYDKAIIWNLRVTVKPGRNSIELTSDNAAASAK